MNRETAALARPSQIPEWPRVVAIIVTRDRPALLWECLRAVLDQDRLPDEILVVDNASGVATTEVLAAFPQVRVIRLARNEGGAGGYHAGFRAALAARADWLWVMDDDGRPQRSDCLDRLLRRASADGADLVGALVLDVDRPDRLAFPIRIAGRTRFATTELRAHGPVRDFVHLFNGALISRGLLERIGLPDRRLFIRGDEVEFLLRARRAGASVLLETDALFLHPGSAAEIHPIFGGLYYAVVPDCRTKQHYLFRNRGYIFRKYGMWGWLTADVVRYGYYFLVSRRLDWAGLGSWAASTLDGAFGNLSLPQRSERKPQRRSAVYKVHG
jgi:rhamnopyranosyl-N-acetylglucosaminyl-diphospho-decaprenol beta-1,3/1,4-galactofuranosyltransferase